MNIILIVLALIILIFITWFILTSNQLSRSVIKIDEALSGIDVALAKRYDVLTKMIDVVKYYAKYEQETLFKVIKLRNNMSLKERTDANRTMNENLKKINILVENYPKLKSNENFKTLQQAIANVEEHLQAARRLYNSNVSLYNQLLVSFPSNIVANKKGMIKKDFFEVDEEIKKGCKK